MRKIIIPLLAAAISLTAGCANRLVVVTHSSVGLDVSGTASLPNKVSFSFERYEATIVPRKTNGEAHSVYGGMDTDMTWFSGHAIKQVFATGEAAKLATSGTNESLVATTNQSRAPLVFFTATTYGLNLSAGEQSMPPNLLLGYRREEAAIIPVPDSAQEVRSVYADIQISTKPQTNVANAVTTNFSTLGGVRIKQSFATGRAAETLAANGSIKKQLDAAAGIDDTRASLRELKAKAGDLVDQIKFELDRLDDGRLPEAITALKDAGVLDAADFQNPGQIQPRELCRRIKKALALKIEDEHSDPTTVQQLSDSLSKLKQIKN